MDANHYSDLWCLFVAILGTARIILPLVWKEFLFVHVIITIYYGYILIPLLKKGKIQGDPDLWKPLRGNDLGEVGDRIKRYFKESTIAFAITAVVLIAMIVAYYTWQSECFGAIYVRR